MIRNSLLSVLALQVLGCTEMTFEPGADSNAEDAQRSSAALVEVSRQQAEDGPWDQGYPKVLGQGFGASGYFVFLNWNGGTDYLFYVPTAGWHRLAPVLAGVPCNGNPIAGLFIDATLLSTHTIPPGWNYPQSSWTWLEPGYHTYAVGLTNDYYLSPQCDRNMLFDYAVIHRY